MEEFRNYCLTKPCVTESTPFDEHTLVLKVKGKIFAITNIDGFDSVNIKVDPEQGIELKERYTSVQPAYHMNKKHWVTVLMDGKVADNTLMTWIDNSYKLVSDKLPKSVRLDISDL